MLDESTSLRDIYCEKFPGAFDEDIEYCGRTSEFVLLNLNRLKGWMTRDEESAEIEPSIPFEIEINN